MDGVGSILILHGFIICLTTMVTNVGVGFHRFVRIGLCLGYKQPSPMYGWGLSPSSLRNPT